MAARKTPASITTGPPGPPSATTRVGTADATVLLWGPKSSGKTMFLYGVASYDEVMALDQRARAIKRTAREVSRQNAILPTATNVVHQSLWEFKPNMPGPRRKLRLRLLDVPGEVTLARDDDAVVDEVVEAGRSATALLFLLDVTRDASVDSTDPTLALLQRFQASLGRRLSSLRVAVCLTKMDSPKFLADAAGYLTWDPSSPINTPYLTTAAARRYVMEHLPTRPGLAAKDAQSLTTDICTFGFAEPTYFGVAAAGFHVRQGVFQQHDPCNVEGGVLKAWSPSASRRIAPVLEYLTRRARFR